MFGLLKQKLKEAVERISSIARKETEEEVLEKRVEEIEEKIELVEEREVIEKKKEEKKGLIGKIKKIREKELTEDYLKDLLWQFQLSLLQSDVALETAEKICEDVKKELVGKRVKKDEIENIVKQALKNALLDVLKVESFDLFEKINSKKPFVILFLGFNGGGKTTTIAKLGWLLKSKGLKVVFAAADTFRAASIEQLEEHGKKLGISVIKHSYGADPAAVVFDAIKHAKARGVDVVLVDTAGRSHANINLMDELKKICRVNKPDLRILVIDSLTGNDVVEQAKTFNNEIGVDALILTKVDVYEKGGSILSAIHTIKKPILFIGVGQNYEDLKEFDVEQFVENLLE
jgi:fused signal recognition particle receptor